MGTSRFACDPRLTGNLTAEYEALQNDLEQAKLLAADYQSQLSDKTNDYAALKATLEKTTAHLETLQSHIVALREERHRLANEVMKVVSLEAKVASLTDQLNREREELRREREKPKRESGSRREYIDVGFDDAKSMEIIPTPIVPKPFRSGPPQG